MSCQITEGKITPWRSSVFPSGLRVAEQRGDSLIIFQMAFGQKGICQSKKFRTVLEVLRGSLHGVHDVLGREGFAMEARYANQQAFHQSKLSNQHGVFLSHRWRSAGVHDPAPEGELVADDGIDQIIFEDVGMTVEERRVIVIVRHRVVDNQTLQGSAWAIADAAGERSMHSEKR